jgi:hypothetical protein
VFFSNQLSRLSIKLLRKISNIGDPVGKREAGNCTATEGGKEKVQQGE